MSGICPYCETRISNVKVQLVNAKEGLSTSWKAAMFSCPSCQKILNVDFDATTQTSILKDAIKKHR